MPIIAREAVIKQRTSKSHSDHAEQLQAILTNTQTMHKTVLYYEQKRSHQLQAELQQAQTDRALSEKRLKEQLEHWYANYESTLALLKAEKAKFAQLQCQLTAQQTTSAVLATEKARLTQAHMKNFQS